MKITPSTTSFIACLLAASSAHGLERRQGLFSRALQDKGGCGPSLDASGLICDPINTYIEETFADFGGSTCATCNAKYTASCGPQWEHSCVISDSITFGFNLNNRVVVVTIAGEVTDIPDGEGGTTTASVTANLGMAAPGFELEDWTFTSCAVENIDVPSCTCTVEGEIFAPSVTAVCGESTFGPFVPFDYSA
jgi:hypothetical protein